MPRKRRRSDAQAVTAGAQSAANASTVEVGMAALGHVAEVKRELEEDVVDYKDKAFLVMAERHALLLAKLAHGDNVAEQQMRTQVKAQDIVQHLAQRGLKHSVGEQLVKDVVQDLLRSGHPMDGYVLRVFGGAGTDSYVGRVAGSSGPTDAGHLCGAGVYIFQDGEFTVGMWKDSKLNGHAKSFKLDGTVIEGPFVNGEEHGMMMVMKGKSSKIVEYSQGQVRCHPVRAIPPAGGDDERTIEQAMMAIKRQLGLVVETKATKVFQHMSDDYGVELTGTVQEKVRVCVKELGLAI
eukprot:COSAG01_NODE_6133_length_3833_cov_1.660150_4_plen_294_part_00